MFGEIDQNRLFGLIVIFCAVMVLSLASVGAEEDMNLPDAESFQRYATTVRSFVWHDFSRSRSVPVVIYAPSVPAGNTQIFPVIVFSHGLGGSPNHCSYLGSAWSSRGFIVVLLQHSGMDENVWKGTLRPLNELRDSYQRYWSGRTQAKDIRFALDRLERLNEAEGLYQGRLDFERIGVGGYDLGALAALLVAGQTPPDGGTSLRDDRVSAVLAMSPPVHQGRTRFRNMYANVAVPVFFVTGTEDDGIVGSTTASQRRIPFDFMSENNRYLVTFQGADHLVYGGHILARKARNDQPFQSAIARVSCCFWQAHLRGESYWRDVVDGHGLNALTGNMAKVERRIFADTELSSEATMQEEAKSVSDSSGMMVTETLSPSVPPQAELEERPIFPLTRYYRSIVMKYDTGYALEQRSEATFTDVAVRIDVEGK